MPCTHVSKRILSRVREVRGEEPVREALRRLDVPEGEWGGGTMVGDSVGDLRAGKAAGLRTAAVLFGFRPEEELRAEGADEYWAAFGEPV